MSRISFENYARRARLGLHPTQVAGRYLSQAAAERLIVPDVIKKLEIDAADRLIEIGCGTGNILIPLSFLVEKASGVDHPDVLAGLRARSLGFDLELFDGNFLDIELCETYSKILIYSVLHCLSDADEAFVFLERALALLRPGGRLLVGDIPNKDRKARFLSSGMGREFDRAWKSAQSDHGTEPLNLEDDPLEFSPDDAFVMELVAWARRQGCNAYVLPQPPDLPFGYTREDVLIETLR